MALDTIQTRFARLLAEYTSSQQLMKQRLSRLEHHTPQKSFYTSEDNTSSEDLASKSSASAPTAKKTVALLNVPSK